MNPTNTVFPVLVDLIYIFACNCAVLWAFQLKQPVSSNFFKYNGAKMFA